MCSFLDYSSHIRASSSAREYKGSTRQSTSIMNCLHVQPQVCLFGLRPLISLILLFCATCSQASFDANLNFQSPSARHPSLGVPLSQLFKRSNTSGGKRTKIINDDHLNFTHGVASGDPMEDSVILWTRISPSEENEHAEIVPSGLSLSDDVNHLTGAIACVDYRISEDEELKKGVSLGRAYTNKETDWTVKVCLSA